MRGSAFIAFAIAFSGCVSYPEKVAALKREMELDCDSATYRASEENGADRLLALEENGRLCQLKGDWLESSTKYRLAMDHVFMSLAQKSETITTNVIMSTMASTYGNELSGNYAPSAFDQMMLHTLDAFNRLALGDLNGFGVNVRNLEIWHNVAAECIDRDRKILSGNGIKEDTSAATSVFGQYAVTRSIDNIYALYVIALYHEVIGDKSNALAVYRDIDGIRRGTATVREAIERLESEKSTDEGEVVVFFEEGFIPQKRACKLYVNGVFASLAAVTPVYTDFDCMPYDGRALFVNEHGVRIAKTRLLCDLAPVAAKSLDECMGGVVVRQIAKSTERVAIQNAMSKIAIQAVLSARSGGNNSANVVIAGIATLGSVAMGIYSEASERADLRSWLLLPRQVQIARFPMKAGRHRLSLATGKTCALVDVEVKPGVISLVHCTSVSNAMKTFSSCMDNVK